VRLLIHEKRGGAAPEKPLASTGVNRRMYLYVSSLSLSLSFGTLVDERASCVANEGERRALSELTEITSNNRAVD
jgi:hypothetical protein